jgi:hypothetical protein
MHQPSKFDSKILEQTTAAQQNKTVAFQAPGTEHESTFVDAFAGADGSSFPGLTGLLAAQADSPTTAADGDAGDCAGQDDKEEASNCLDG